MLLYIQLSTVFIFLYVGTYVFVRYAVKTMFSRGAWTIRDRCYCLLVSLAIPVAILFGAMLLLVHKLKSTNFDQESEW